jgi:SAM-dependent methyltransferase
MKRAGFPAPSTYWDHIAQSWECRAPQRLWRMHSDAVCLSLLDKYFRPDPRQRTLKTDVFDEAVARGILPLLAARCDEVVGCDISLQVIHMAKQRYSNISFIAADVRGFPFSRGCFDWVVSLSTLDHLGSISEVSESLREIFRILKSGGKLFLTLDNLVNPVIALRNFLPFSMLYRTGIVPYSIGTTCGPRRLRKLLTRAGFIIEEMRSGFHCPRVLAIPLTEWIDKHAGDSTKQKALDWLMRFEELENWPTHFLTGHLIIALAQKP